MGHGGKFFSTNVPISGIVESYAALGNMDDAIRKTEGVIDRIGEDPNEPKIWEELEIWEGRIKSRSITLQTIIRKLRKSQEK